MALQGLESLPLILVEPPYIFGSKNILTKRFIACFVLEINWSPSNEEHLPMPMYFLVFPEKPTTLVYLKFKLSTHRLHLWSQAWQAAPMFPRRPAPPLTPHLQHRVLLSRLPTPANGPPGHVQLTEAERVERCGGLCYLCLSH